MTDIRRLGQLILARIAAEVSELDGRALDKATETTPFPYAVIRAIYGSGDDAECIEADIWTIQIDVWDRASNKLRMAELGQKVRRGRHAGAAIRRSVHGVGACAAPAGRRDGDAVPYAEQVSGYPDGSPVA